MFFLYVEEIQLHISVESSSSSPGYMRPGGFLRRTYINERNICYIVQNMLEVFEVVHLSWIFNTVLLHRLKIIIHPRPSLTSGFSLLHLPSTSVAEMGHNTQLALKYSEYKMLVKNPCL